MPSVLDRGEEDGVRGTGVSRAAVEGIWGLAEALYRTGAHPAIQLCIRRRGRVVLDRALGHARGNAPGEGPDTPRIPVSTETPFCLFSASKAMTAMVIHKLDELGVLHIEDRVADYIPEFGTHGKQWMTIRHLLAHRAGIPNIPPDALDLDLLEDPDALCAMLSEMKPRSRVGQLVAYHAVSGGFVLAEVVRRATGTDIRAVQAKEVCEPLGFRWMNYGVAADDVEEVALNALTGPPPPWPVGPLLERALGTDLRSVVELSNDPRFVTGIIPAANVMSNARELSAFYQCLLDEGQLDGVRVFEPRSVRHAIGEQSYRDFDLTLGIPLRYGLGLMLGDNPVGIFGQNTARAFGHLGFTNIWGWADPQREIAVALVTSGKPIASLHVIRVVQLIAGINGTFPRRQLTGPI